MKPKFYAEISGIKLYHVHKEGYGKGDILNTWLSTSDKPSEHEKCKFAYDNLVAKYLGDNWSWEKYFEIYNTPTCIEAIKIFEKFSVEVEKMGLNDIR